MTDNPKDNQFEKSLFIFRRDLRLEDNTGLFYAVEKSKNVIPIFIYDEFFLKHFKDSQFRWNFLNESLIDLNEQLKSKKSFLEIYRGTPKKIIEKIIKEQNVDSIFMNTDFSFYSKKRDLEIHELCSNHKISLSSTSDFLLHNPNEIKTNLGNPYTIYSQFYKKARLFPVRKIQKNLKNNFNKEKISNSVISIPDTDSDFPGGRSNGLKILKNLDKFKDYDNTRNYPITYTTRLSPHLRFGTVSIREVYDCIRSKLGIHHTLMGEIYWREFFNHISFHFPFATKKSFKKKYQKIQWSTSKVKFDAWRNAKTGFPIIDAGMEELNQTGFMHNRVRMIVASFLTKDLHIDWKLGERYFAQKLVDYDPAVNAGNWQWAASTGCDSVPYFRIFNPWLQQEKFDKDCIYIKKWIPKLDSLEPTVIHNLWKNFPPNLNYPKPMVHHKAEAQKSKDIFKEIK